MLQMLQSERLPHAIMLEGVPGTGRGEFAHALARHLLCAAPTADGNCGECKSCVLSSTGAHADFHRLVPEEPGKAIGIDAVRAAIRFATGTATQGMRKVMLVSPAQSLTTAAFNAFLKCLEEPSPGTFIVLVCARGYAIPATILSRCQRWPLRSPDAEQSRRWLEQSFRDNGMDAAQLTAMLAVTANRPLNARLRLESGDGEALINAYAALRAMLARENGAGQRAEMALEKLSADDALSLAEDVLRQWLREQDAPGLRSAPGHRALEAVNELSRLRAINRSGSNPNPDLLRFSATQALAGLWAA
jgi:DNA polymerase-3 subunit delta'